MLWVNLLANRQIAGATGASRRTCMEETGATFRRERQSFLSLVTPPLTSPPPTTFP